MSWAVFYYSGAASAAGTNYRGALVVTPDGRYVYTIYTLYVLRMYHMCICTIIILYPHILTCHYFTLIRYSIPYFTS